LFIYGNIVTEMSRERNGQTQTTRPKIRLPFPFSG